MTTQKAIISVISDLLGLDIPLFRGHRDGAEINHRCYATDDAGYITYLNLASSGLTELPHIIGKLESLDTLRLLNNQLADLPAELANLTRLRRLYLPLNRFERLPRVIPLLGSLEVLALNGNHLASIPPSIRQLTRLRTLGLSNNCLTDLPPALAGLPSLRALYIGDNPIGVLPSWIGDLSKLEELSLAGTRISVLPRATVGLRQLRAMSIAGTRVSSIDPLLELASLTLLNLRGTALETLPEQFASLTNLESLDLSETHVRHLGPGIGQLRKLRTLHLRGLKKLAELPPELFTLTGLRSLSLSGTHMPTIPSEIGRLQELTALDLSGMGLSSVPPTLFALKKLTLLNLSSNRLRELPPQIAYCDLPIVWHGSTRTEGLFLERNPIESPPLEVVKRGRGAVKAYFRSLRGERKAIDEVKILLVGDGGSGKTSLVKKLLGREFDEHESQTHGINIEEHFIPYANRRIKARIWDFGGQEIMHATHQFFLSKRSAYVLVLDGRRDEKTEYWLKHVEAFGGDSPIIIVVNKIDQNPSFDVNRRFLMEKYRGIRDVVRVSCATGEGIGTLQRVLKAVLARLDYATTVWPSSWFAVKGCMESLSEDFISLAEFRRTCQRRGICDPTEQDVLAEFLHDLGVVLRFADLPLRDTNVINPRWLTDGVYRIVNSEEVAQVGGIVKLELLNKLLPAHTHPPEKHHFIIELMKKFELCYGIDREQVLLPALLPIEEPRISIAEGDVVRFLVEYDFLPKSVLPRLIVRMQSDIEDTLRWRSGVVLRNACIDARAIVKADEAERRITISVYGTSRRDYLGIILHELRGINGSFEKIRVVEKVPMPDRPDVVISYAHLLRLESKGIRTYIPDGTDKEYDVQDLLGYVKPSGRTEDELLALLRQLVERGDTPERLAEKVNGALVLQPNLFGVGINLNGLIRQVLASRDEKANKRGSTTLPSSSRPSASSTSNASRNS